MPGRNALALPNGRVVEVCNVYSIAFGFTHWALSGREQLPDGYLRT
jgi:hypothetical protein